MADDINIKKTINWLIKASNACEKKGFSSSWSYFSGWGRAYPETTGYIIPSLLNFSLYSDYKKSEICEILQSSADWLVSIQNQDGSFGMGKSKSIAFDTGQILFGLAAMYEYSKSGKYLQALKKSADWLSFMQEEGGFWEKSDFNFLRHSYSTRISWALLECYRITGNILYKEKAIKNLDWAISLQEENGWFNYSYFIHKNESVLHTIAYTIEGLLESGILLDEEKYINFAKKTADVLLKMNEKSILCGYYGPCWEKRSFAICLTGLAQMSLVWAGLFEKTGKKEYFEESKKVVEYLKKRQSKSGAVAGSWPIFGKYCPFMFPNWAAKFFMGALLRLKGIEDGKNYIFFKG